MSNLKVPVKPNVVPNRIEVSRNPTARIVGADYYRPSIVNQLIGRLANSASTMPFEPPQIVDVHQYYPKGTIDWDYLQEHNIIVQISVGIGNQMGVRYLHQIEEARKRNLPVVVWHIPDCTTGIVEQVQEVFSWPYVKDYVFCMDVEKPRSDTRVINATEFKWYAQTIESLSRFQPMVYSSEWILRAIFGSTFPSWYQYHHWIAQYVYKNYPYLYEYFDDFVAVYGCQLPPSVKTSSLFVDPVHKDSVVEWQFTHKGREPFVFPGGPLSRDLSLGLLPIERLLKEVIHWSEPEVEPWDVEVIVQRHANAINQSYLNNVDYYNYLGGDMKATGRFPDTTGKTLEEKHITEAIAFDLGILFKPYLYKAKVSTGSGLKVRNAPSTNGAHLRSLPYQSEITIYEEKLSSIDPYTWGRIDPVKSEWCAVSHGLTAKI